MATKMDQITNRMLGSGKFPREWVYWFQEVEKLFGKKLDTLTSGSGQLATINADGDLVASGKTPPTGVIVGTTDVQTLSAKTLTSPTVNGGTVNQATVVKPTIADFTNAAHDHEAAAGGATLDHGDALTGKGDDDHAQYMLLAGRSGQTVDDDVTITGTVRSDTAFNASGSAGLTQDVTISGTTLHFTGGILTSVS